MSAYCENNLDIFGDYQDILHFIQKNKVKKNGNKLLNQNVLTFNNELSVNNCEDTNECKETWGTKNDADVVDWETDFDEEYDSYFYKFMTSGNPPHIWLKHIAEKYNTLEFNLTYINSNTNMQGEIVYRNGVLYNNTHNNLEDQIWGYINEDLSIELVNHLRKVMKATSITQTLKGLNTVGSPIYTKFKNIIENYDENSKIVVNKGIKFLKDYIKNIINDGVEEYSDDNMNESIENIEYSSEEDYE